METEIMNGSSTSAMFDSLVEPAPLKQKKKKKHKEHKKAKIQAAERRVLHYVSEAEGSSKLLSKVYERELARLQVELVKMQYWVKHTGVRIVILSNLSRIRANAGEIGDYFTEILVLCQR